VHEKVYRSEREELKASNRMLKLFVAVIGATNVLALLVCIWVATHHEFVITPPGGLTKKVKIKGGIPNADYLRQMGMYVATLAKTYTPATVKKRFAELLLLADPSAFTRLQNRFDKMAADIVEAAITSAFWPTRVFVKTTKGGKYGQIAVIGNYKMWMEDKPVQSGKVAIVVKYRINWGRFYLRDVREADPTEVQL